MKIKLALPTNKLSKPKRRKALFIVLALLLIVTSLQIWNYFQPKSAEAAWWDGGAATSVWGKRKQLTLTNESSENLAADITVAVTVDTSDLVASNKLQSDCDDLRVVHDDGSTVTEVTRHLVFESGTTCSTSKATKVHFPLQAALNTAVSTKDYYMYYDNEQASTPANTDNAFDIGAKDALLVCPFNGSTTCAATESPSTETGAIRYGGAKTAMEFDDNTNSENIALTNPPDDASEPLTIETWFKLPRISGFTSSQYVSITGGRFEKGCCVGSNSINLFADGSGNLYRFLVRAATDTGTDAGNVTILVNYSFQANTWYHAASVIEQDGTFSFYVNGQLQDSTTITDDRASSTSWKVGGTASTSSNNFVGIIDEIRISNVARYTSNFTPQTTPFVRDEYTKVLFHFDENGDDPRNTGKVIDDSGNENHGTIGGSPDYVAGLVGVDRDGSDSGYVSGSNSFAGHEGIFIEEGTTNKFTNPSFEHSTYDTSWTASASATLTKETTSPYYKFGSSAAKMVISGADSSLLASINVGNTNDHTLSAYVYNGTTGDVGKTVDGTIAQLHHNGVPVTTTYTEMGGGWWRLSATNAGVASSVTYGVEVLDTKTVYIDGMQLEENGYITTYTDGSLTSDSGGADTYFWDDDCDGTLDAGEDEAADQNAQCSSRTAEDIRYSTTNNISGSAGTISMWVKNNWDGTSNTGGGRYFFSILKDSNDYLHFRTHTSNGNLQLVIQADGGTIAAGFNTSFGYGGGSWKHIVATWSSGNADVYVNGSVGTTDTYTNTPDFSSLTEFIGQDNTNSNIANSSISNLQIFDTALSSTEVADLYQAGLVAHSQGVEIDAFGKPGEGPIAIYHFDESYGTTANDSSRLGNHLTLYGPTWDTQSVGSRSLIERYLSFDGTDDQASSSAELAGFDFGTGSFSVSGWFRHSSTTAGTDTIVSKYGDTGFKIYMDSSGYVCTAIDDDSTWGPDDRACSSNDYADSRWHHFEAVIDRDSSPTALRLYIDGNQANYKDSLTSTLTLSSSTSLFIGSDTDNSNYWDGDLDEIIIYPYARSADQVKADVVGGQRSAVFGQSTQDFLTHGLVGYWKMDKPATTSLGETNVLGTTDSGNGDYLLATKYTLDQAATIESLSFYVRVTGGQLRLGIYDDDGGYPGSLKAETAPFTPGATGWATEDVVTPTELAAGDYWIAYHPESSTLGFWMDQSYGDTYWYVRSFAAMPATFAGGATSDTVTWSFYATLNSTAAVDSSGNGNDGSINLWGGGNTATSSARLAGKFGGGIDFDGTDDNVDVGQPSVLDITGAMTFSVWVNSDANQNVEVMSRNVGTNNRGYAIKTEPGSSDTVVSFDIAEDTGSCNTLHDSGDSSTELTSGQWYHLVGVYKPSEYVRIYINGVMENENTSSIPATQCQTSNYNLTLGDRPDGLGPFDGTLDEARVYNRALSPAEVQKLHNWAPGPVGYWDFNENTGSTTYDKSGNENNGTMTNSGWVPGKFGSGLKTTVDNTIDNVAITDPSSGVLDFSDTNDFTITAWVRSETDNEGMNIFRKGAGNVSEAGYRLYIDSADNKYSCRYIDGDGSGLDNIDISGPVGIGIDGVWHFIACVVDRDGFESGGTGGMFGYLDGIANGSDTSLTEGSADNSIDVTIGEYSTSTESFATIDEVKIYNYARTPQQIVEDMNAGHPAPGSPVGSAVGHWKFDEGYGDIANNSGTAGSTGNANLAGTAQTCPTGADDECPTWSNDGKFGKTLEFSTTGVDEYAFVNDPLVSSYPFTTSVWMKTAGATAGDRIFSLGDSAVGNNDYTLRTSTGNAYAELSLINGGQADTVTGTSSINDSNWHHVVGVFTSSTERHLYLDGKLEASGTTTVDFNSSVDRWGIGREGDSTTSNMFDGWIDEAQVFASALTQSQINQLYNQGRAVVFGAKSSDTSGQGTYSADSEYCPPGSTDSCVAPVGEWKFDENTGTTSVYDTSGNGNTGTMNGSMTEEDWVPGKVGRALDFDGSDDYVQVSDDPSLDIPGSFTLSSWVYLNEGLTDWGNVVNKGEEGGANPHNYFMDIDSNEQFGVGFHVSAAYHDFYPGSSSQLSLNTWHHLVGVFDDTNDIFEVYLDGVSLGTDPETSTPQAGATDLFMGETYIGLNNWLPGKIDDLRIYNYARTPAQIAWSYNRGGPIGWWRFDECEGAVAYDASGNGNNGTITPGTGTPPENTAVGTCSSGNNYEMWNDGTNGKRNASLGFDGNDDYVSVGNQSELDLSGPLTLATWIKTSTSDTNMTLVFGENIYSLWIQSNNEIRFSDDASNYVDSSGVSIADSNWHHVAGVFSGSSGDTLSSSNIEIYLDGKEIGNQYNGTWTPGSFNGVYIADDPAVGFEYNGQADDVKIFNYALTAQQIKEEMNKGAVRFE